MQKIFIIITLLVLTAVPAYALELNQNLRSTSATGSTALEKTNARTQNQITNLKQRANTEIARRINFLNELLTKLNRAKKITDTDKASLKSQIQAQIDGLTTLRTKIDQDTELTTLKADVKSIITGYYIFAFFRVEVSLLFAADRLTTATDNMSVLYTKLQTRINDAKNQGKDTAALEAILSDMQVKINDAKTQYTAVKTELALLTAQGFPGNKSTLLDARSKLKLGASDLKAAYQDAVKIRQGLGEITGNLKPKTGTGSALENHLPETK